jgi:hypothetical protein
MPNRICSALQVRKAQIEALRYKCQEGTGVQMAILDQDNRVTEENADLKKWQGVATYSGQYFVRLSPVQNVEKPEYKIRLGLEAE